MKVLMVPVRVDALILETDQNVMEACADFSKMPYFDGLRDINPDTANLSEALLSQPFQNDNLLLRAGVHLHWSLPDTLTHGSQQGDDMIFPAVPNRWLVSRFSGKQAGARSLERQWVVESDYLFPEGEGADSGSVSFPFEPGTGQSQPFRYLGRVLPLDAWTTSGAVDDEYLPKLTVLGYGDPRFAAFYPNCRSVFGFHDDLPDKLTESVYEVIGWYSDGASDHLKKFTTGIKAAGLTSTNEIVAQIEQGLAWKTIDSTARFPLDVPEEMLCYARIRLSPEGEIATQVPHDDLQITLGNTAADALAAYLGKTLDGDSQHRIENQLECLRLSAHLRDKDLDLATKLRDARHERGFTPSGEGFLWSVQQESEQVQAGVPMGGLSPGASNSVSDSRIKLPDSIAVSLNRLNELQQQYTRVQREINALREQTFTDWYKYMAASYPPGESDEQYPDIDQLRFFIETRDLVPLNRKIQETGELNLETDATDSRVLSARSDNNQQFSLAYRLAREINELLDSLTSINETLMTRAAEQGLGDIAHFSLLRVATPRFWRPNDPVILLTGEAIKSGKRHGRDGLLCCDLLDSADFSDMQSLAAAGGFGLISYAIDRIETNQNPFENCPFENYHHGFTQWQTQPWNPLALEWRMEVRPVVDKSNLGVNDDKYDPEFIRANYALPENKPDLELKPGKGALARAAGIISGHCILTPGAAKQAQERLEAYLIEKTRAADETQLRAELKTMIKEQKSTTFDDPVYTALMAYEELQKDYHLAQMLDGFHEALLMRGKTLQLLPSDPIAFAEYRDFTNQSIRHAIGNALTEAPDALNDFLPVRSGCLALTGLRVLDSFGRFLDVNLDGVIPSKAISLTDPDQPSVVSLSPRLSQPARLNFRFLASQKNAGEMNSLPNTNPICGWLMPNNLDNSLLIYDGAGFMLGYINKAQEWRAAPGDDSPVVVEDIENVYLRRVIRLLLGRSAGFFKDFISALNRALENIDPDNYAQHQSMALLVGRPMAVVRASLNIELEGPPALHQGWMALRNDMNRLQRETNGFEAVKFPIRLGEFKQFNDGLVGYWKEGTKGIEENAPYYAPQSDLDEKQTLIVSRKEGNTLAQSIADAPQIVTMLMDPRGSLHATCGILPVKEISLPPAQYTTALENIDAVFLRSPIITPANRFSTPLSQQSDHVWSWLEREGDNWREISSQGTLKKAVVLEAFSPGEMLWEELLAKNWIRERVGDPTKADVVATDERSEQPLDAVFSPWLEEVEVLLDGAFIHQPGSSAEFPGLIEIREGWLRLTAKQAK